MEASREPLHRGESCHHQPLELAPGPHFGLGVPHPAADGHLQTDPRQQGRSFHLLDTSVHFSFFFSDVQKNLPSSVIKSEKSPFMCISTDTVG